MNFQYYYRYIPLKNIKILLIIFTIFIITYVVITKISSNEEAENSTKVSMLTKKPSVTADLNLKHLVQGQEALNIQDVNVHLQDDRIIRFGRCLGKIVLAVVVCGNRRAQTLVTLKSAVALATTTIHLVVMADKENQLLIAEEILEWPSSALLRLSFEIHPITFPKNKLAEEWRKLFRPCAAQRLFLPNVLPHLDSLLYVDTDVLFLRSPDDVWAYFSKMNSSQMAALSPEHEDFATGWYNRFARHPFYQPLGVNSGVMLMNLTRLRSFQWVSYLEPIFQQYKQQIVWGDQDIINIIFHYHSDKLYIYGCEWNYRPDHCMYSSVCKTADPRGVSILHGSRGTFANGKQPAFRAVYQAFDSYLLGSDLRRHLLEPLKESLATTINTNCGRNYHIFYRQLEHSVSRLYNQRFPRCSKNLSWTF